MPMICSLELAGGANPLQQLADRIGDLGPPKAAELFGNVLNDLSNTIRGIQ